MILNGSSNGIDLAKYSKDVLDESRLDVLKKQYAVTTDNFCFLAVGRMVRDKGIVELVTAFLDIYKDYPETRLFLLGPFEQVGAVPGDIVEQINAHPAIVYVKWSDEVEYFMALAKCLVHASHREGFPNVVLQAAAMGTPIICSDISGNTDIVQDNKEGYLYPVKDIAALEKTMQEVVSNYETALKKAEILKQKVIVNYDRTAVHKAIKERYINLLVNKQIDVSEIN
jgi:glycosyltransferase involved in cell wall biosynthesis